MFKKLRSSIKENNARNKEFIDRNVEYSKIFEATKSNGFIEVDEVNRLWKISSIPLTIYEFDEIIDYELVQDGEQVTSGGLGVGRALVGGALAGPIGALMGGLTKSRKTQNVVSDMYVEINVEMLGVEYSPKIIFVKSKTKTKSTWYKKAVKDAEQTIRILDNITHEEATETVNAADELLKYKELLDADAITQDEFEEVKKKLLNI